MPKDIIDLRIKKYVAEICETRGIPEAKEYIETDNLGEVIDKLIIVHIRTWMLEDAVKDAVTDTDLANIKRKIDICFKQKRPKLVEAINRLIEKSVIEGKSLVEDSVKAYKSTEGK
jgi:2-phosphoglycerate kinase